jgi:hypothetical protein
MNYYQLLGVEKSASAADIKRAFRRLAIKYHPDKNPDPQAEELFKQISEAYDVLGDPVKRVDYDIKLTNPRWPVPTQAPRHRDPAYRPNRPKVRRKSDQERIRDLMAEYLPYTQKISIFCFAVAAIMFIDFVWPARVTDEEIATVSTRRSYSRNSSTTWWVIKTTGGHIVDLPYTASDHYQPKDNVRIHTSFLLGIPLRAEAEQHNEDIKTTIYGNFIFAPIALLIISSLAVLFRKRVDYGFNLAVTSFVILVFLIFIILVL